MGASEHGRKGHGRRVLRCSKRNRYQTGLALNLASHGRHTQTHTDTAKGVLRWRRGKGRAGDHNRGWVGATEEKDGQAKGGRDTEGSAPKQVKGAHAHIFATTG